MNYLKTLGLNNFGLVHFTLGHTAFYFCVLTIGPVITSNNTHLAVGQEQPEQSIEGRFVSGTRQLTFDGQRAGEGYFSQDRSLLVFQSERRADNPFFQIYLLDFETGDVQPISPGHGKTTCAWIHPNNNLVLYASTQADPEARAKQKKEIEFRESGQTRRYSWDYDETYELFSFDRQTKQYSQLTNAVGYDAEGSYSPDGKLIAFASNRNGYSKPLNDKQKKMFETDPAFMMEIYIMNADGTNVRQLTDTPGYDGGPFFSPDGKQICWRRFSENGLTAEIMTMNIDGSNKKQLTKMNAMSWAPFYHPSGKYLVFTTNKHGFGNFELYLVDVDGKSPPVRVTDTDGFDGLASFTPDGKQLTWTSNRNTKKESQIYLADWNHQAALKALSIADSQLAGEELEAFKVGTNSATLANADFDPRDIVRHVDYLCRKDLGGRMTGSAGERKATAYVAAYLSHLKLKPAGDNGTWFQTFDFPDGAKIGDKNRLDLQIKQETKSFEVDKDWRPLTFSGNVEIDPTDVVCAGYGIVAPKKGEFEEYDSYVHLDVADKWVMVFRFVPENVSPEARRHFTAYGGLRKKVFYARENGAKGLIVVSGPNSQVRKQLVPLQNDFSPSGSSIAAISVTDALATEMLKNAGKDLRELQDKLDDGSPTIGFNLDGFQVAAQIDVDKITGKGRNVVGRLQVGDQPSSEAIIVGAHIDHLGSGKTGGSLAKEDEKSNIHFGADDNASGVAAMLEIAEYIALRQRAGQLELKRDIIFAGWSGEELGLHGSAHYADNHKDSSGIIAALNMDMVGRLTDKLVLQGVGSSSYWPGVIESRNVVVGLPITLSNETDLPTDASSFYRVGIPILSAFTGSHTDYHTPRDTPEKLNYPDTARIARLMGLVTQSLATNDKVPDFVKQEPKSKEVSRGGLRAYLGSIPSYGDDVVGVKLSGVANGGPADKAGVQGGDLIIELAGKKIENIYDYTAVIDAIKIGEQTKIIVVRDGKKIELNITPGSRQ